MLDLHLQCEFFGLVCGVCLIFKVIRDLGFIVPFLLRTETCTRAANVKQNRPNLWNIYFMQVLLDVEKKKTVKNSFN